MPVSRDLSNSLADAVVAATPAIVRVDGESGARSGLVWSDGTVLSTTDEEAVTVTAADGSEHSAELAGRDAATGIAVLRVPHLAAPNVPRADIGALRVGNLALALARPGTSVRATFGMITTLGGEWRLRGGARIDRYIDTDIVLPGEFGGSTVIVDADGALIGFGVSGRRHHRGLIVPHTSLAHVVERATGPGAGQRPYLGIATYPARVPAAQRAVAGQERGLMVLEVEEQSPAAAGGVLLGDVVLRIGATSTANLHDLFAALSDLQTGAPTTLHVLRGAAVQDLALTPGVRS
jgi:S1-C subfamily serine protease